MAKPLITLWSMAAFEACANELDQTQKMVLTGVGELAAKMDGWFFHTFTSPAGHLMRCDAQLGPDDWQVHVRLAHLVGEPPNYPEAINIPANEKFADFREIKRNLGSQQSN